MRYPPEHKATTRQSLVRRSGSHAKRHGFSASGLVDLAAAAGLTTGALYKHFNGKSDLFTALITEELARTARLYGDLQPNDGQGATERLAGYLSAAHVQQPEHGCVLPSLTAEVARADLKVRGAFQTGLLAIHANVRRLTGSSERAWVLIAQNVGAVMLARALIDPEPQTQLLQAIQQAGEDLLIDNTRAVDTTGQAPGAAQARHT